MAIAEFRLVFSDFVVFPAGLLGLGGLVALVLALAGAATFATGGFVGLTGLATLLATPFGAAVVDFLAPTVVVAVLLDFADFKILGWGFSVTGFVGLALGFDAAALAPDFVTTFIAAPLLGALAVLTTFFWVEALLEAFMDVFLGFGMAELNGEKLKGFDPGKKGNL